MRSQCKHARKAADNADGYWIGNIDGLRKHHQRCSWHSVAAAIVIEYTLNIYLKPKSTFRSGSSRASDFSFFFLAIFAAAIFLPFYSTRGEEEGRMDFESGTFSSAHSMRRSRCRFVSCAWIKRSRSNRYFSLMLSFSIRLFKLNGLYDHKRCLFHVWQTFSSRHFSPPCRCERVCCLTFEHSLHIALAHAEAAVAAKGHSAIDVSVVIEQFGMECTQSYLRIRALVRWLLATQAHR